MPKLHKIIDGKHIAERDGFDSHRAWVQSMARRFLLVYTGRLAAAAQPVKARIDFGRWSAFCPNCGGSEYVDVDDLAFYCLSCGNEQAGGDLLPIEMPPNRQEIEELILERDVLPGQGRYDGGIAMTSRPLTRGLERNWSGEPAAVLRQANRAHGLPGGLSRGAIEPAGGER